jgi:uncharacterized protein
MMRSKLLASVGGLRTYAVVFEAGDDPVAGLRAFARGEAVAGAALTAIGAFRRVVIGWFDLDRRDYARIELDEQVEVLSLVGDITGGATAESLQSEPTVHAHAVLGRRDGAAVGGHLLEAVVRPTLEVVVTETPAHLRRRHDAATGLALIDLSPVTQPQAAPQKPRDAGGPSDDSNRS